MSQPPTSSPLMKSWGIVGQPVLVDQRQSVKAVRTDPGREVVLAGERPDLDLAAREGGLEQLAHLIGQRPRHARRLAPGLPAPIPERANGVLFPYPTPAPE